MAIVGASCSPPCGAPQPVVPTSPSSTGTNPPSNRARIAHCDAYLSLHRAEGYGLQLADAMALGKPVIATGYSGNLTFMDADTAYPVDCTMTSVGAGCDPYPADEQWAEPDLDHAASLIRAVLAYPDDAAATGRRAAAHIAARETQVTTRLAASVAATRAVPSAAPWREHFMGGWRSWRSRTPQPRYRYDWLADGTALDEAAHELLAGPDAPTGAGAGAWLAEPVVPAHHPVVSRYLQAFWARRLDLQALFPDLERNPHAYLAWVEASGWSETDIPAALMPSSGTVAEALRVAERVAASSASSASSARARIRRALARALRRRPSQ